MLSHIFVSTIVCMMLSGSFGQKTYTWEKIINKELTVKEFAVVEESTESILMSATDSCLSGSGYLPTLSLHDFKSGQVALKRFAYDGEPSVCYIQPVASNYSHALRQLKDHSEQGKIELGKKKYILRGNQLDQGHLSKSLEQFCHGLIVHNTTEITEDKFNKYVEENEDAKQESIICIIFVLGLLLLPKVAL